MSPLASERFDPAKDGYGEADFAIAELLALAEALRDVIHWSLPEAELNALDERVEAAISRYDPARALQPDPAPDVPTQLGPGT